MISYNLHTFENGLVLIYHQDKNTELCVVNTLYNVGSRDENPNKTGFAHLFEHLMFGGSVNIPDFDQPIQMASGENNAFTSNDITNYYITLPKQNIETALWLESDRMLQLDFSQKSLDVQKGVVIEEFKQRYLNQPYSDCWLHIHNLVYKTHPYNWATIGKEISHIENATLEEVKSFFFKFYNPNNAIICLAGNIGFEESIKLVEKWYIDIPKGEKNKNIYQKEPDIIERREQIIKNNVPQRAIYMCFKMVNRLHQLYPAFDLLSDILGRSNSARLIENLIKKKSIFSHVSSFVGGEIDEGLFIIEGKLTQDIEFEEAENAVFEILEDVAKNGVTENEIVSIKNKFITSNLFSQTSVLNKAMALCYGHLLGNANFINEEIELYKNTQIEDIKNAAKLFLNKNQVCVLKYEPNNQ